MSGNTYEPIKLIQTNRYAGYQFYARIRIDGMSEAEAFRYLILTVCEWMLKRIPEDDRKVPELQLPPADQYADTGDDVFQSYHFSIGYALDITPLMESGIWALRLKEPDQGDKNGREPIPGRFFTTRIGIVLNENGYSELGIKIDVTDPASVEKEVDFAFRPGFVRNLFENPAVHVEQVETLRYEKAVKVNTEEDYRRLLYVLDNEDNQLPLVVFTYARPAEVKPAAGMSIEELVKSDQVSSLLKFSGVQMTGIGAGFPSIPQARKTDAAPVMPYDADIFAGKAFAYGITYVLGDQFTDRFRNRLKKDFRAGDILLCGARKFRSGISTFAYPGEKEDDREKVFGNAVLAVRKYSKHKAPYSFGKVVFEAEARKMEQHTRVMQLVDSGTMEAEDKIARLKYEMEMLFDVIDDKDEDIKRLNGQVEEAYRRGQEFRAAEYAALEEENAGLQKDLNDRRDYIEQMQGEFQRAREINNVITRIRSVMELPEDNAGVVGYYKTVYGDRLGFTKRGEESAALCTFKPSSLWKILHIAANQLVDVFAESPEKVTEEEVQARTGYRMSFREGSMTRENPDMMRLREDVFEGKTISVEPHLKLRSTKGELTNQRLHFWYDQERKRIIIGYIGEHLESASSKHI